MLRRGLLCVICTAGLVGCAQPTPPMIWIRTDGQQMGYHPELMSKFTVDKVICNGEMQKAGLSGVTLTNGGILANAVAQENRNSAELDVGRGCMAERGYVQVPANQATATSIDLASEAKTAKK